MDNDNKIDSPGSLQIHQEVQLFLKKEIENIQLDNSLSAYHLEEEYEKTRKHKSPFTILVLAASFFAVVVSAAILTIIISNNDKNVKVELSEFNDLNLKNLLDTVGKVQTKYDNAVNYKTELQADYESEKKQAELKREQDMFVIESMNIANKTDEKNRLDRIQLEYVKKMKVLEDEYQIKFQEAEAEIEQYKKELEQYDTAKIEAAQEQERLLNSERLVQELERQKLAAQYEERISELENTIERLRNESVNGLKGSVQAIKEKYQAEIDRLDPKLHDDSAIEIIQFTSEKETPDFNAEEILSNQSVNDKTVALGFDKFQSAYDYYLYLDKTVASIPQKNSIPGYVAASKALVNNLGETFTQTTLALENEKQILSKKNVWLEENYDDLIEDYNDLVDDFNQMCDDFEEQLADAKANQKILENKNTELVNEHKEVVAMYDEVLNGLMIAAKSNGVIYSAESKDDIRVYVASDVKELVEQSENGLQAEFKAGKITVKGNVLSDGNKYLLFVPALDKNGNEISFDMELITSGISVKIKTK